MIVFHYLLLVTSENNLEEKICEETSIYFDNARNEYALVLLNGEWIAELVSFLMVHLP